MAKTIYHPKYRQLIDYLRERRERLGLSQSGIAKRLGWSQQKVSQTEAGARRLDVLEYIAFAEALELTPARALAAARKRLQKSGPSARATKRKASPRHRT